MLNWISMALHSNNKVESNIIWSSDAGEVSASGGHHADLLCEEGAWRVCLRSGGWNCGHWYHGKDGKNCLNISYFLMHRFLCRFTKQVFVYRTGTKGKGSSFSCFLSLSCFNVIKLDCFFKMFQTPSYHIPKISKFIFKKKVYWGLS